MPPIALLVGRLILVIVFGTAGFAKLADRGMSRQALVGFGIPRRLAAPLGILLPLAELATAAGLISAAWAWLGGLVALFLLLLFVVGISLNLALGRTPECRCLGQLHSAPLGWSTLCRNFLLACSAGLVAYGARHNSELSMFVWMHDLTKRQRALLAVGIGGLALLVMQCVVIMRILRQQDGRLVRLRTLGTRLLNGGRPTTSLNAGDLPHTGLPPGTVAPSFKVVSLGGEPVTLNDLLAEQKPALLLFTNPKCAFCQALMPEVARWLEEYGGALMITLISEGTAYENHWKNPEHGAKMLLQEKREVAEAYLAYETPAAVLVRTDSTIGSFLAEGAEAIRTLIAQSVSRVNRR